MNSKIMIAAKLLFFTFLASSLGNEIDVEAIASDYHLSAFHEDDTTVTDLLLALLGKINDLEDEVNTLKFNDADQSLKLAQLQLNDIEIETTVQNLAEEESCTGVIYNNTCIRLLYIVGKEAGSWSNAESMCQFHGGRLAEIETDELFNQVYEYVKKSWNSHTNRDQDYVVVLLGMKYLNGELVFVSTGNSVPGDSIGFWRKGYPSSRSDHIYMRMSVPTNRPTSPQVVENGEVGFFNLEDYAETAVPLCQFPLMF